MAIKPSTSLTKAVDAFTADFEKAFGTGSLQTGKKSRPLEVISTGSVNLDLAVGVGGYVKGRINEIWGPDGIGKTALCLIAAAEAQKAYPNKFVAVIDAENKMTDERADAYGVDRTRWMKYVAKTAEEAADAAKKFLSHGIFSMVILDSIGALISAAELEAQADKAKMAEVARVVTRMMGTMTAFAQEQGAVVILVNQLREKIDSGGRPSMFKTYARTGGWKLKYTTTFGLKVGGSDKQPLMVTINGNKHVAAREISVKVERNKVYAEGAVVKVLLHTIKSDYGPPGIDQVEEVVALAPKLGVISREGVMYVLPGGQKFRGEGALRQHLRANPEVVAELRKALLTLKGSPVIASEEAADEVSLVEEELEPPSRPLARESFLAVAQAVQNPSEVLGPPAGSPEPVALPGVVSEAPEAPLEEWDPMAFGEWGQ